MIKVSIDRQIMQSAMTGVADQINSKIDPNIVEKLCKERYGIETIKGVENKNANIVVIENQVACKLDFEVRFPMSMLITSKKNSNSTLSENNTIPEDLDDILLNFDDMPEEFEMPGELDKILEEKFDVMGKSRPPIGKGKQKP
jgi:hypothetical protein